jgi:hypothetical protein
MQVQAGNHRCWWRRSWCWRFGWQACRCAGCAVVRVGWSIYRLRDEILLGILCPGCHYHFAEMTFYFKLYKILSGMLNNPACWLQSQRIILVKFVQIFSIVLTELNNLSEHLYVTGFLWCPVICSTDLSCRSVLRHIWDRSQGCIRPAWRCCRRYWSIYQFWIFSVVDLWFLVDWRLTCKNNDCVWQ